MPREANKLTDYEVPANIVWRPKTRQEIKMVKELMKETGLTDSAQLTKHLYTKVYNQINSAK